MSEKVKFKFRLGQEVKDKATEFKGSIDAQARWLNGCIQYSVRPKIAPDKPHDYPTSAWIDEAQLELTGEGVEVPIAKTGGPRNMPQSR